ncbi:MAG: hypothetical protein BHV79_17670 [Bacteroides uniformis]|jgi:hypothetical protein|uniref:Uncharacterized protein n=1 Tax=Bacteroides uniformis TaxID=820 RepID=A0A1Q6HQB3_BACUN|nr:MAG: hypothetical protein BHV79_17670 [Bacteroides uniformis]
MAKQTKEYVSEITPEIKDKIISRMISFDTDKDMKVCIEYKKVEDLNISKQQFEGIINQLLRMRLIERPNKNGYGDVFNITVDLYDLHRFGGFVMHETILLQKMEIMIATLNSILKETKEEDVRQRIKQCLETIELTIKVCSILSPLM